MNQKPYFEVVTVPLKGNKRVEHTENLDKIMLPFYCYYSFDGGRNKKLGVVDWSDGYYLQDHSKQTSLENSGILGKYDKLLTLIKKFDIDTVKVKIIVFE